MEFSEEPDTSTRRPRVLVAEDDDDMRALVVGSLRADGYEVVEARDGAQAVDAIAGAMLFDEDERAPDIIITDVRLPGINGLSLLAGLRAHHWATPIIVMTAYQPDRIRPLASRLGADATFAKPFAVDDLRAAVANLLHTKPRPRRGE